MSCAAMPGATASTEVKATISSGLPARARSRDGETYDGGAGSDTLLLGAGVTLPAGVVLTDIDTILYG